MKLKINLDTQSAATRLVGLASGLGEPVYLTDGAHIRVSAKSMLGTLYARFDFTEIWLETEGDHYFLLKEFEAGE
jgi:hypothetical protein